MLKLEGQIMNGFRSLGINREDRSKFLKLNPHDWDDTYALDIRHPSIVVSVHVIPCIQTISRFKT